MLFCFTKDQEQHREWLIGLILYARTGSEIALTRQELDTWVQQYPEDLGITDGFDHLAMSEGLVEVPILASRQAA